MASYKTPKTIKKSFNKYSETKTELKELSKLKIMAVNGRMTEQKVYLSIEKPEAIEVVIYDLSNFSITSYSNFNRSVKELAEK